MEFFHDTGPIPLFWASFGYMVRSGAKLFRTKTLLNFASKALSNLFFQKTRFQFEFLYKITPYLFSWQNGIDGAIGGKSVPERSFVHPKKHVSGWNFFMIPAPDLFSGPHLAIWCVRGQNCSGWKLCSILPQKPTRVRFSKKRVFGLNFGTKSHHTYFLGQTD